MCGFRTMDVVVVVVRGRRRRRAVVAAGITNSSMCSGSWMRDCARALRPKSESPCRPIRAALSRSGVVWFLLLLGVDSFVRDGRGRVGECWAGSADDSNVNSEGISPKSIRWSPFKWLRCRPYKLQFLLQFCDSLRYGLWDRGSRVVFVVVVLSIPLG